MNFRHSVATIALATALLATSVRADEGMWTFDAFPAAAMKQAYGFAPDQAWLDRVRGAAVRLTGGCSASLVSGNGLVLTNHHCVVDCVQTLSTPERDSVKTGFVAGALPKEAKCPGQQGEIVTAITDVTPTVKAAIGDLTGGALVKARNAARAKIESEGCTDPKRERCQVVTLFGGNQYKLYKYHKYSDVRLVFAPELQAAFFGGDPDNFNFPRYALDFGFLRLYEDGKPVATPGHLKWNARAPKPDEAVFIVGNPGSTQRLFTEAQRAMRRQYNLPTNLLQLSELRGRLIEAMASDPEKARTGADELFGIENSYKALFGQYRSLLDPAFSGTLATAEATLRAKVAADPALAQRIGDPWADVDKAMAAYRNVYYPYRQLSSIGAGQLAGYAEAIVRAAAERTKPNGERLPEFTDAALPLVEKGLTDARPVYPWLEELNLCFSLSKTREYLKVDTAEVRALLGKESPEALAKRLVGGTKLADPAVRKALFDGGAAAVAASTDPMIRWVAANDAAARAIDLRFKAEVEGPTTAAATRLNAARFAVYGDTLYPDATFTLRISYGKVAGWVENGVAVPPVTRIAGLFDRATGSVPFDLAPSLEKAKARLDPQTVMDFVTTNDIIGGNSGSPAIDRDGTVIGAAFDGNIHSLGGNFGYDPALNRTVIVSAAAIQAALDHAYDGRAISAELKR